MDEFGGTLEHFAGDGMMIFFNDPFPVDRPAERAVRMAIALQEAFRPIAEAWEKLGHEVGLGIGIAQGEATLGVIGFEQRWEYAAIGNVPNLAARLCGAGGRRRDHARRPDRAGHRRTSPTPSPSARSALRGFQQPVPAFRLKSHEALAAAVLRAVAASMSASFEHSSHRLPHHSGFSCS